MKLGIVGAGKIVQEVLPILKTIPNIDLMGITTRESSYHKLAPIAEMYGIKKTYATFEEMINSPEMNTIYIANYNNLHFEFAARAIKKGKHLIIEKPMVLHLQEFNRLHELAQNHKVMILEAVNILHLPNYHKVRELLPEIGDVKVVSCNLSQYSSRYAQFQAGEILPVFDVNMGGGALTDLNIYNLNFIVGLFGTPEKARYQENIERGVDTSGIVSLSYEGFKAVAIAAKDSNSPHLSFIQGNKGYIEVASHMNEMSVIRLCLNGQAPVEYRENGDVHRLYHEFVAFTQIIDRKDHDRAAALTDISKKVIEIIDKVR